ncbi:hypothetical protein OHA21_17390 [Actinoplanes sp. NBC_00393]|uniref:hypothetical protein n=1 Tax=Actinoplanes sp. NBC_00393 TaxID=2975953 RepID=UPI002E228498
MGFLRRRSLARLLDGLAEAERRSADDPAALDRSIELWDRILEDADMRAHPMALNGAGWALLTRFRRDGAEIDCRAATRRFEQAYAAAAPGGEHRRDAAQNRCTSLVLAYEWLGDVAALDQAITLTEAEVADAGSEVPARLAGALAEARFARFRRDGRDDDLRRAIALAEQAVAAAPDAEAAAGYGRNLRTMMDTARGETAGMRTNVAGVSAARAAVTAAPQRSPDRGGRLLNLGATLYDRFVREGDLADLAEAVTALREARTVMPPVAAPYAQTCAALAVALLEQAARRDRPELIAEAVTLLGEATDRTNPHAPDYAVWLSMLGNARSQRYVHTGDPGELDAAIAAYREALDRLPAGHTDRPGLLNNLGSGHWDRYGRTGRSDDLSAAADAYRDSLAELPGDTASRATVLGNLANVLAELGDPQAGPTYRQATRSALETTTGTAVAVADTWGRWATQHGDWAQADDAYALALTAMRRLRERQLIAGDRETWLLATQHLPVAGAYAAAQAGHAEQAALRLETGRAMSLSEALQRDQRRLAGLDADAALRPLAQRFRAAARVLASGAR